jgi:hypothetical protein
MTPNTWRGDCFDFFLKRTIKEYAQNTIPAEYSIFIQRGIERQGSLKDDEDGIPWTR